MFERLFRRPYPSSAWRRRQSLSIDADGDRGALCGVSLGQSIEDLSLLGPADDPGNARQGVLSYFSLGLEVRVSGATFKEVSLILADTLRDGYRPFRGSLTCGGRTHVLATEMREQAVPGLFGTPGRRSEVRDQETGDLEEVTLSYSSADVTCELIVGTGGIVEEVHIVRGGRQ